MSTDKPWFKFNVSDWMTGDIRYLELEAQAVFINLCALIWKNGGSYKINSVTHRRINTTEQVLNKCIQVLTGADVLLNDDGVLTVKFINEQLDAIELQREKKSKAGKISAEKRKQSNRSQQVSTIKKEERRKKKVDNRDKIEDIYKEYPKKVGKGSALKAIEKALDKVDYDTLLEKVKQYAKIREGEDPQFTPNPATWFNQERWEDEPQSQINSDKPWERENRPPHPKELIELHGIDEIRTNYPSWFDENGELKPPDKQRIN